jgi:hypothetical protein
MVLVIVVLQKLGYAQALLVGLVPRLSKTKIFGMVSGFADRRLCELLAPRQD